MALNTRLTQNIDLQADASTLVKALGSIETSLNNLVSKSGTLSKSLEGGANAGNKAWAAQLKQLNILMGQAQNLQKVLDAMQNQKGNKLLAGLDEQALGKKGAAASRLAQDLTATSTAADVLEKRLATLNKRFAELTLQGRTVGQRDLAKQLNTEQALKDVRALEREYQKLSGQTVGLRGTTAQKEAMAALRTQIVAANAELGKMGQNYRRTDFAPQIAQIRQLTDEYRRAISEARKFDLAQPGRAQNAQRQAVGILNQSDSQRLADIKRSSSQFQFPSGVSQTTSQQSAEDKLAQSLNNRLRLLNMIQAAQDRGAPTRSVERLNDAYKRLGNQLGEDFKLLTQINAELNRQQRSSFLGQVQSGLGRAGIITGASIAVTGVYAVMNAVKEATKFVVEYEAALKGLQAISGSTDEQMGRLAKSIGEVGRSSTYSLLEITKAATVIAQAGFSAQETGGVLADAITLSTASGSDPSKAVEVLTAALGAFQLQAGESGRVVDTLVTGLNRSKLSIDQMGSAIQYAGATANEAGIRFEELTTIAASMANAGIRSGSTIGTGIRQLIVDMQTPSEKFLKELKDIGLTMADVDIKAKGFAGVVKTLAEAGFTAEAAYASFETRAAAAFLAFKGQIGTYDQLALAIAQGGAAADAQAKAMDSLSAQWNRLKNDLGVLAAGMAGPLLSALKVITSILATVTEGIIDFFSAINQVTGGVTGLNEVLVTLGATGIGFLIGGPIGAAIGLFLGLASVVGSSSAAFEELRTKTSDAEAKFTSQTETVNGLDSAIEGLVNRSSELKDGSVALQTETVTLAERFGDLYSYLGKASVGYEELLDAMLKYRGEALKQQGLDAQVLKTNAQIELNASRQKLDDTAGFVGNSNYGLAKQLAIVSNGTRGATKNEGLVRQVKSALSSNDISEVTMTRNNVALYSAANNNILKDTLTSLEARLALIKQVSARQRDVINAETQIGIADAASNEQGTSRNRSIVKITGSTNTAISAADAGNYSALDGSIATLRSAIAISKKNLAELKEGTGEYIVLQNDISKVESQLARLVRKKREKDEADAKIRPDRPDRAAKGLNLTGSQVKTEINKAFPGSNVYSEKPRSYEKQVELYNNYKKGTGPLAAKPGTSRHGGGNAIDMTPMKGVNMDQIVSYLEGLGLEVTEKLNERDPKTGRYHWHFAWKPKTSTFQKNEETNLAQLRSAARTAAVGASTSAIQAIITQGKAGTDTSTNLSTRLESSIGDYRTASLAKYDNDNPAAGLSGDALKIQQQGRSDVVKKIEEDAEKFRADLYRSIGDVAQQAFDTASAAINLELEQAVFDAGAGVRDADRAIVRSSSRLNKDRTGAGTSYYLQQQQEAAQLNTDRMTVSAQDNANAQTSLRLDAWKTEIDLLPNGEAKQSQLNAYNTALKELNNTMRATDALQQSINDRTQTYTQLPLEDRLKNATAAWADNSGIMQDWTSVMENNVGPALDMMTNTLTDVFSQIMQGSMGIKGALTSIISAVGQFVVQLIAKALALAAIKWFLKMIGVELVDTPGGVSVARMPGKLQGGEIKPKMMMAGGQTSPGYVSQGVANKDTVPILGARGEFMLRKAAVDSLGLQNVEAMNRHGSRAVDRMAGTQIMPAANNQEMSVYIIKPDEKPQLGPRDMVLAITDDMLQGGVTKQLVKKISQGAM